MTRARNPWGISQEELIRWAEKGMRASQESAPGQEAVAWIGEQDIITQDKARSDYWKLQDWKCIPLYLAPQQQEQKHGSAGSNGEAWAWANAFVMELIENHDWMGTGSVESGERDKKAALAKWAAILSHPHTATASQESAPEAGGEARPVAYRAWLDDERGARWVFTLWPEEEHLEVIWEPLFLAPPTSTAIAAMVIKQAADGCREEAVLNRGIRDQGTDRDHYYFFEGQAVACEELARWVDTLTPANAEAELEALMMKVAEEVQKATLKAGVFSTAPTPDERRAIVRRVLDEMKGE